VTVGPPGHAVRVPDPRIATTSEYGVLGVRRGFDERPGFDRFSLDRYPPTADLAGLVERYWLVSWELPPGREAPVTLLPHPCVNVVLEAGRLGVFGVVRDQFTNVCRGVGGAFGVKFRPGGFLPFLGRPVSEISDVALPAEQLWGPSATALADRMSAASGVDELVALVEAFLRERWPPPDPQVDLVQRIVAALLHDRTIARVDDVTELFNINPRTLQRLFQRYVGVSPKWVLRRYRLHEAAAALAREHHRPWAEVAAELGYFDQSHFIRDFTAAIGMTPVAYAQACRRMEAPVSA
jgi:AraC-like DNA-binding protein